MKILREIILLTCIVSFVLIFFENMNLNSNMAKSETLKTGISLVENIPKGLFGTWRVGAVLKTTDSPSVFRNKSADLWNLSKTSNVMNLTNPYTGASADLAVEFVKGNVVKFIKEGVSDDKKLVDVVEITLNNDKFTGTNRLSLQTISPVDGKVLKTQNAVYVLVGEKISGLSIIGK